MELKNYIHDIPDFPKPWIIFKDISPLLWDAYAFKYCIDELAKPLRGNVEVIVWLDARGFIFWSAVAYSLGLPFVMIRKPGKLPGATIDFEYDLEYGSNTLALQTNTIKKDQKVAIVDDVLATWWTTKAAIYLIEQLWGKVEQVRFLMSLSFLPWEQVLSGYNISSLIKY